MRTHSLNQFPISPDETNPEGLEALYRRGRNAAGAVAGVHTTRVPQRRVFLRLYEGGGFIEADLRDSLFRESNGQIPPEVQITCPFCGGDLHIDGTKKSIRIRYLEHPVRLVMPDNGEVVWNDAEITVDELCECSYPSAGGKGKCIWKMTIRDNVVSRVRL